MESLSPESRQLYDMITSETEEIYEAKFLSYKKEMMDAVKKYVHDTTVQIKDLGNAVDSVQAQVGSDLRSVKESFGQDLEEVKISLGAEIGNLTAAVDRFLRPSSSKRGEELYVPPHRAHGHGDDGPVGHRSATLSRGLTCAQHSSPPAGGMNSAPSPLFLNQTSEPNNSNHDPFGPRVDLPQFDGTNPKLWQRGVKNTFSAGILLLNVGFRMVRHNLWDLQLRGWKRTSPSVLNPLGPNLQLQCKPVLTEFNIRYWPDVSFTSVKPALSRITCAVSLTWWIDCQFMKQILTQFTIPPSFLMG